MFNRYFHNNIKFHKFQYLILTIDKASAIFQLWLFRFIVSFLTGKQLGPRLLKLLIVYQVQILHSTLMYMQFTYIVHYNLYSLHCAFYLVLFTLYISTCIVYIVHFNLCSLYCAFQLVQFMYISTCIVYIVHFILCSLYCTFHLVQFMYISTCIV